MQPTLVIYDITDARRRAKVAALCQDYGLSRIQMSAFLGKLKPSWQRTFIKECSGFSPRRHSPGRYVVHIVGLSSKALGAMVVIGKK